MNIQILPASGLEKIFPDTPPKGGFSGGSLLSNERYSFQFAFSGDNQGRNQLWQRVEVRIESDLSAHLDLYLVKNVPVMTPTYVRYDDDYLRHTPGLYPDPLLPLENGGKIKVLAGRWQSLWVRTKGEMVPGKHTVKITIGDTSAEVELTVLAPRFPEQELLYTNWLHCDCIADLHRCEIFSEDYWDLLGQYMALAGENGMNMVLVPAFTPPLDTPVGGERMTAQLIDVTKDGNDYRFGFEKLDRYIALAQSKGITWFEHSHLFTQWGAKYAPKVMAVVNGELRRIFGWETDGTGEEYGAFLRQYLDALEPHLRELGVAHRFYYHISDEPTPEHLESYRKAKDIIGDRLSDGHFFEALSHFDFYETGLVPTPVVATDAIHNFVGKANDLWAYYTGFQSYLYSNRLISLCSRRNRVIGLQMYKNNIQGFLHWGFNFYYTTLSREKFDPMTSPDALGEFPAGTCYQVYPTETGPIPSLRLFVFHDGIEDMAALRLLETKIGRDGVVELMEQVGGAIEWNTCPASDERFLALREAVNREIAKHFPG